MNYILFDYNRDNLLPFTFTRPVADIRVGILTIREKWELLLQAATYSKTQDYLSGKFPAAPDNSEDNIWINGTICPDRDLAGQVQALQANQAIVEGDLLIALNSGKGETVDLYIDERFGKYINVVAPKSEILQITKPSDIFTKNGVAIEQDFQIVTAGRKSRALSETNRLVKPENIFVEEGAVVEHAILNASSGPIYIGKDAEVMEGSIVRGPLAMGEHAVLKLGTKIYGPTTIGPYAKVGGEVNNSVVLGYSNKAHDGFLGNSVIGEWCNLGADTNNSNLKNNYGEVKLWSYATEKMTGTGLQFCGLIMGDHSKCGINTMFNTGTVVGVNANIFGAGFPPTFIPSFSWGGADGFTTYQLDKAAEVAQRVWQRRNMDFNSKEQAILSAVFEMTKKYRA